MRFSPRVSERRRLDRLLRFARDTSLVTKLRRHLVYLSIGWILIFVAVLLAIQWQVSPYVTIGLGAMGGILGGIGFLIESYQKQWPLVAPYIDAAKIERRLAELTVEERGG
jgi:hypothetical protein